MATETKFRLILADIEQIPVGSPVRVVTGGAVAIFDGRVDHLFLAHRIMALVTERCPLFDKTEAFPVLAGMFRRRLDMTGEAIPIDHRLVTKGEITNGDMAVGGQAGIGRRFDRGGKEQPEGQQENKEVHDTVIL